MSESDAALRFDGLLDQLMHGEEPPADALGETARTVQQLHTRQRSMPSDAFRARLRASLTEEVPMRQVNGRHPAVIAVPPVRMPERSIARPAMWHRWLAIAAVLALVIGGIGAFALHPWGNDSAPEPSAIPAAMLGTVESSPVAEMGNWTVAPPAGTTRLVMPGLAADGRAFTVFAGDAETAVVQAVDLPTGTVLWSGPLGNWTELLVATAGDQLLATGSGENGYALKAYDGRTGEPRWQIELEQRPVALLVHDDQILVLGSGNGLDAFDLGSRQLLWHADLSKYDDAAADDTGMNAYFNLTGSRLAETDGVVGAIVSNGRLVGVDAADGAVQWADERTTSSATTVAVVDDRFVVTASGSDKQGYDYDGAAGTPIPETDRCQAVFAPRSGSTPSEIRPNGAAADSFDPTTGNSPWGVESNRPAWLWPLDDSNLIAMVSPGWDTVNDQPQNMFPCKIDGATGEISDLEPSSLAEVVLDGSSDTPTGMAGFPNGGSFVIPDIDPDVAASLPHVGSGTGNPSASWLQTVDGMTLVVLADGTLIGLPKDAPKWTATEPIATPDPVTLPPVAWTLAAPDEADQQLFANVVTEDRVYRPYQTEAAGTVIQAIDTDAGTIVWEKDIDLGSAVLATDGDRLLVAGGSTDDDVTRFQILSLDRDTGNEVWRTQLHGRPVAIAVRIGQVFTLGEGGYLDSLNAATGETNYFVYLPDGSPTTFDFLTLTDASRMAIAGDTLAATLMDGGIVGVDTITGEIRWRSKPSWIGATAVYAVGDTFVAVGDAGLASSAGSTMLSLASPADPALDACHAAFSPGAVSVATPGPAATAAQAELLGLDSETGSIQWQRWSFVSPALRWVTGNELVQIVSPPDWREDQTQLVLCGLDGATGEVAPHGNLRDDPDAAFTLVSAIDGLRAEVNIFDGQALVIPTEFGGEPTERSVEIDGFIRAIARYWVSDGAFYLSFTDGRVMKIDFQTEP